MKITPTLNFGGQCREAIQIYAKAFGGKISCMITYGEANDPAYISLLSENQKDYIYHNGEKEILTNLYFEEDLEEIKKYMSIINCNDENESSVVDLLVGFFEYYSYKYNHYLISISRSDKIEIESNENIAFPLEDPFDIGYNPGKSMKLNTLQYNAFICCMKKELNNILSGEYFQYGNEE